MPFEQRNGNTLDFAPLSLDLGDSDFEDSDLSSPCKPIKNASLLRQSPTILSEASNRVNCLDSYSFSSALKHAGRASSRQKQQPEFDSLLNLRHPSFSIDDGYSPLHSPTESVQSLTSCGTYGSAMSELDSELNTEVETDGEPANGDREEDTTETDFTGLDDSLDSECMDDTPVSRPPVRRYPMFHRANRSVLGISFSQHQTMVQADLESDVKNSSTVTTNTTANGGNANNNNDDEEYCDPLEVTASTGIKAASNRTGPKARSGNQRRSIWPPPNKVRRTQSMFATPEQMLHEQQLGNFDRAPACQSAAHGTSFLNSPECPIPTFTVRQDPFPRITHETLCKLLDGVYRQLFSEVIVIDCRFEYEYEGGHIDGAINVNSKQQLEQALFSEHACQSLPSKRLLIFHCEYSAYRSPLLASHLRSCDRTINAARYPNLCYPDVLVLDGGYSGFYNAASDRCVPRNYVGMNHQAHQNTRQKEMSRFRNGMKARKFQSLGMKSSPQLNDFRFPEPMPSLYSASVSDLHGPKSMLEDGYTASPRAEVTSPSRRNNSLFGF